MRIQRAAASPLPWTKSPASRKPAFASRRMRSPFRQAEGIGYHDIFMMRRWYNMEFIYNLPEAERICGKMIDASSNNPRALSEFWSKRGQCHFARATSLATSSREKPFMSSGLYR